jgi:hypothetical protein
MAALKSFSLNVALSVFSCARIALQNCSFGKTSSSANYHTGFSTLLYVFFDHFRSMARMKVKP